MVRRLPQEVRGCASQLASWWELLCRGDPECLPSLALPGCLGLTAVQLVYRVAAGVCIFLTLC